MQMVACNSLHTVEERMCRWLLMMHDRAEGEYLSHTHEFLSHMMGANRTSITRAAQSLQDKGLISYRRGLMQIQDRAGLAAFCEAARAPGISRTARAPTAGDLRDRARWDDWGPGPG